MSFTEGQQAYTRRLYWNTISGVTVQQHMGEDRAWVGMPCVARIVKTRLVHRCRCCGSLIGKGELHGADEYPRFTDHYCLGCLTADRPETQYRSIQDPPSKEDRSHNAQSRWAA